MAARGLPVIEETVEAANAWLDGIAERTGTGRRDAYHILRAGLHALRDRLTVEEAADLGQQLPTLVRGIYFEEWRPAGTPLRDRSLAAWLITLEGHLLAANADAVPPRDAARAVFGMLRQHVGAGACRHLAAQLPDEVAALLKAA
jgi:uncharacterized protein (DUF2267 family)